MSGLTITTDAARDQLLIQVSAPAWFDRATLERVVLPIVQEHRPPTRDVKVLLNGRTEILSTRRAFLLEHGERLAREIGSHAVGFAIGERLTEQAADA